MELGVLTVFAAAGDEALRKVDAYIVVLATNILNPIIALGFMVTTLLFIWGVFGYIRGAADSSARTTGTQHILYGVIGMTIMVSVYGIINFISATMTSVVGN